MNADELLTGQEDGAGANGLPVQPEPTLELIRKIRAGSTASREALFRRFLPLLRKWAHGRLPASARDLNDTDDLIQVTLLRALNNIGQMRLQHPGSFFFYLKQTILNAIRDDVRRQRRRYASATLIPEDTQNSDITSQDLGTKYADMAAYDYALKKLPRRQQRLLIMRLEFGLSYDEIATECGCSPDAARMMVTRAVTHLTKITQGG